MWWYIAFGIVFSIYAVDLLFLFIASLFAAVVEHFVPPISTAACRAAKRRQRAADAKQQLSGLKPRAAGAPAGSVHAVSANGSSRGGAANGAAKGAELAIVVDTRGTAPSDPVKPSGVPGASKYGHLTDLYRGEFPKVMIQLPMYNEDAHCDLIIQRCCKVMWPSHRILIQVGACFANHIQRGAHVMCLATCVRPYHAPSCMRHGRCPGLRSVRGRVMIAPVKARQRQREGSIGAPSFVARAAEWPGSG
jgi:hypothetical protein